LGHGERHHDVGAGRWVKPDREGEDRLA
jgi:hypothetical protein